MYEVGLSVFKYIIWCILVYLQKICSRGEEMSKDLLYDINKLIEYGNIGFYKYCEVMHIVIME